jgi:hypothetical protein
MQYVRCFSHNEHIEFNEPASVYMTLWWWLQRKKLVLAGLERLGGVEVDVGRRERG